MVGQIRTSRLFLVASLLASTAACSSAKPGTAGYTKIDDMEGQDSLIEWPPPAGTTPGSWWSTTDCSEVDRISPVPSWADPDGWSYAALPAPQETFPGVISTHAARLRTISPLVGIWGAGIGVMFAGLPNFDGGPVSPPDTVDAGDAGTSVNGQPCSQPAGESFNGTPVDLSAYTGVTFWAMADPAGVKRILVQLIDGNTDPRGGVCNAGDPSNDANCNNGFGVAIALTDTLKQVTIDFSSLKQDPTWGYHPDPSVLDIQHVYGLSFQVNLPFCPTDGTAMCPGGDMPAISFDFWIDDLYFVNR